MTNNTELDMIEKFYIGDRIDSDKLLCVTIKTCGGNSLEAEEDQEKKVRCWKSGCIEKYKEVTKDKSFEEEEEVGLGKSKNGGRGSNGDKKNSTAETEDWTEILVG